jgi:penicillin-binding protein 1A
MASTRGQAGARREPVFDKSPELHVSANDRPAPTEERPVSKSRPPAKRRKARARKSRPARGKRALIVRLAYWTLVVGLWVAIGGAGFVAWVGAHLPPIQSLEIPKRPPSIQIVDFQGRALARRGDLAGAPLPLKELPAYVPKAFIAIEDRRFYEHSGVDPYGIGRAFIANVLHRGVAQGGSTITQQLAKNLFLTQERTINRKLQEALLAIWLERKFSKTQILSSISTGFTSARAPTVSNRLRSIISESRHASTVAEAACSRGREVAVTSCAHTQLRRCRKACESCSPPWRSSNSYAFNERTDCRHRASWRRRTPVPSIMSRTGSWTRSTTR